MKISRKKRLFIALIAIITLIIIMVVVSPDVEYRDGISSEYKNLLNENYRNEVTSSYMLINENKFPFSAMFIDSFCDIFIYRLPIIPSTSIFVSTPFFILGIN